MSQSDFIIGEWGVMGRYTAVQVVAIEGNKVVVLEPLLNNKSRVPAWLLDVQKMREAWAIPDGLSEAGQKAAQLIMSLASARGLMYTGGCKVFYSPQEWQDRGEAWATKSDLIVVYDGGDHRCLFTGDYGWEGYDAMTEALAEAGLHIEAGTNWYSGIYKD